MAPLATVVPLAVVPKPAALVMAKVPADTVVIPVYVLAPESVHVPAPSLVTVPEVVPMMLAMLPQVSLGQAMIQLIASILCYPLVVGATRLAFGVRKPATGEVDAYGRRM